VPLLAVHTLPPRNLESARGHRVMVARLLAELDRLEGFASSWPVLGPLRWLPGLRLDHVFASRHFGVTAARRGEGWGSDHRPVEAELVLREE